MSSTEVFSVRSVAVEFCLNQDGNPNISCLTGFLHSRRTPQIEARRFVNELCREVLPLTVTETTSKQGVTERVSKKVETNQGHLVLLGLGWGYLVEELLKHKAADTLFFFEPIPQVYELLRVKGRLAELEALGARIFCDLDALRSQMLATRDLNFSISPTYKRLFPNLLEQFTRSLSVASVDHHTSRRFLRQWMRNAFRLVQSEKKLSFLTPNTEKDPVTQPEPLVVYCGASPTLLEDLEAVPETAFVMAVDTALGPLVYAGRRINLAICVDSGYSTFYHLRAAQRYSSINGLSLPLDCDVLSWLGGLSQLPHWFRKTYYYRSSLPFDQILGYGPLKGLSQWDNPTRNPLGLALHVAHLLGAKQLYCAGTSFLRHGHRSHERGTGYQEYALLLQNRCFHAEMYEPGGYGEELSPKNKLAWTGALKLAKQLQVELKQARDLREKVDFSHKVMPLENAWEQRIATMTIETQNIISFLQSQANKLDFSVLEKVGLNRQLFHRYMRFFNHGYRCTTLG